MFVCYVDESGDTSCLQNAKVQPAMIVAGLIVEQRCVNRLTQDFLTLKQTFNPNALPAGSNRLDWIKKEIKGTDVRKAIGDNTDRQKVRQSIGFLDKLLKLLEAYGVRIVGRVWIKEWNVPVNHVSIYCNSIQYICEHFQHFLQGAGSSGLVIMDHRSPGQNIEAAHSIFTQKHRAGGDNYPSLLEAPTFGHSDNHAGLQLADAVSSAFLWPMAMHAYCEGQITSLHIRPGYWQVAERFGDRIKRLQHRYQDASGRWCGGISVSDRIGKQPGSKIFQATPPAPPPPPIPPATT